LTFAKNEENKKFFINKWNAADCWDASGGENSNAELKRALARSSNLNAVRGTISRGDRSCSLTADWHVL